MYSIVIVTVCQQCIHRTTILNQNIYINAFKFIFKIIDLLITDIIEICESIVSGVEI